MAAPDFTALLALAASAGTADGPRDFTLALAASVGKSLNRAGDESGAASGLSGWDDEARTALAAEVTRAHGLVAACAAACAINLPGAVRLKMARNAAKYPADLARGRADKYTAYSEGRDAWEEEGAAAREGEGPPPPVSPPQFLLARHGETTWNFLDYRSLVRRRRHPRTASGSGTGAAPTDYPA